MATSFYKRSELIIYLIICVSTVEVVLGQVSSLCRPNERLLPCGGCQKTCKDPSPVCLAVCQMGCYCNEGEVRNDTGHCIKLKDCPPNPSLKEDTSEPRPTTPCPDDEEYRFCEPCNKTCDNPNPMCPAQCARGCFCVGELVRDKDGKCKKYEQCSNLKKEDKKDFKPTTMLPYAYKPICNNNQVYKECGDCDEACSDLKLHCENNCTSGCFCMKGYVRSSINRCVKVEDCPKATLLSPELSIDECGADEQFFSCGYCEPTCRQPEPSCPSAQCTTGCLCKTPLLRHRSGHCVKKDDCDPKTCSDPNEEYSCLFGCELRCGGGTCARQKRCDLGCHCRVGFAREPTTGKCIKATECSRKIDGIVRVDVIKTTLNNDTVKQ